MFRWELGGDKREEKGGGRATWAEKVIEDKARPAEKSFGFIKKGYRHEDNQDGDGNPFVGLLKTYRDKLVNYW